MDVEEGMYGKRSQVPFPEWLFLSSLELKQKTERNLKEEKALKLSGFLLSASPIIFSWPVIYFL